VSKRSIKKVDLARLDATREEDIDYSEIAELDDSFWDNAVFMPNGVDLSKLPTRPKKVAISVRLDDDILSWLKKPGAGYQKRINGILRYAMISTQRPVSAKRRAAKGVVAARKKVVRKKSGRVT